MKPIRGHVAIAVATLFVGVPAVGCGAAEPGAGATSDNAPPSEPRSTASDRPDRSDSADPGSDSPRPKLAPDDHAPVADDLELLVEMFVRYAVGDSDTFAHGESVSMSLGGEPVVSIDDIAAALPNRKIWKICPPDWDLYGASSCPVDLLGPINNAVVNDASLVYSAEYDDVTCAPTRTGPLPTGRLVVLRPVREWRTCASDFALVLAADHRGRLRSVDLTLSDP